MHLGLFFIINKRFKHYFDILTHYLKNFPTVNYLTHHTHIKRLMNLDKNGKIKILLFQLSTWVIQMPYENSFSPTLQGVVSSGQMLGNQEQNVRLWISF